MSDILLTTINAKWIHPSLALRLLKANLGNFESSCEIIEFALRQPLAEKLETLLAARPKILGVSVSIWNHSATIELLAELSKAWAVGAGESVKPVVILGGPEVSHLPPSAEIFKYADHVIRGEGEIAFRELCGEILEDGQLPAKFIEAENIKLDEIKTAYHLYTDEDLAKKLTYVEASRGCPFKCEFCLSAADDTVREFPLEPFLSEMNELVRRGAKSFKFLDRSFNININRAVRIMEFFLEKIEERKNETNSKAPLVVHFEMVPSLFPQELREILTRFQPETLRLEIGIQTLNAEVAERIGRPSKPEKEPETLRFLSEETNAIIHADLIAGLPGEDIASFARGFDRLWLALSGAGACEIQLGILKLLPGAPIVRHSETFGMVYNPLPPYEVMETGSMNANDIQRVKNFARFWEIIVNRKLVNFEREKPIFDNFVALSDALLAHFGRNWGIDMRELKEATQKLAENVDF